MNRALSALALVLVVAQATPAEARGKKKKKKVEVTLRSLGGPIIGDGRSQYEIQIRVSADKPVARRLRVGAEEGQVVSVGEMINGVATFIYVPPEVDETEEVKFRIVTYVGKKRVKRKIELEIVSKAEAGDPFALPTFDNELDDVYEPTEVTDEPREVTTTTVIEEPLPREVGAAPSLSTKKPEVKEEIPEQPSERTTDILLGLGAGYSSNFGLINGPTVRLHGGLAFERFPRMRLGLETGFGFAKATRFVSTLQTVDLTVWTIPVLIRLMYERDLNKRLAVRGILAAGVFVGRVNSDVTVTNAGTQSTSATEVAPAVGLGVGGLAKVGPGGFFLELGYQHANASGSVSGNIAGLVAIGGYQFRL